VHVKAASSRQLQEQDAPATVSVRKSRLAAAGRRFNAFA
jgi:hypothetical protein